MNSIKIGVSGPFTGPRKAYGEMLLEVFDQFRQQYPNPRIDWILLDDMASPSVAVQNALVFAENKVQVVVGHFNSACAVSAAKTYREAGITFLAPATTSDELVDTGEQAVFRFCPGNSAQAKLVLDYVSQTCSEKRVWVIFEFSYYADSILAGLQKYNSKLDLVIVDIQKVAYEDIDKNSAVYFVGSYHLAAQCRQELSKYEYQGLFIASDDAKIADYITRLPADAHSTYVTGFDFSYKQTCELSFRLLMEAIAIEAKDFGAYFMGTGRFDECGVLRDLFWKIFRVDGNGFKSVYQANSSLLIN